MFQLHPYLERDTAPVCALSLCEARVRRDARFPWLVLIPRIDGAEGFEDVTTSLHARLMAEIALAGRAVTAMGKVASRPILRLNVGILGNIVPQLHVHIVGRRRDDPAWPGPVWGHGLSTPYSESDLAAARGAALAVLTALDAG